MFARGIILMALGAFGTAALIGLDQHGSVATAVVLAAGVGTLAVFFVGTVVMLRGWSRRVEVARVDELADDVEQEARVHLLENREAQLVRQIEALEAQRDEVLAQTATARAADDTATRAPRHKPNLIAVSASD